MKEINLVTPKRRKMLEHVDEICASLHLPAPMKTFVTVTRMNEDGQADLRVHDMAHTWNLNYYKMVGWMFIGVDDSMLAGSAAAAAFPQNFTLVVADGSMMSLNQSPSVASNSFALAVSTFPNVASLTEGIVIGAGVADDTIQTYTMPDQFKTAADWKIVLPADSTLIPTWNAATRTWTKKISKTFQNINAAKAAFTVTETGLAKYVGLGPVALPNSGEPASLVAHRKLVLFDRTKLAEPINLPYNTLIKIDYSIVFKLPADVPMVMA